MARHILRKLKNNEFEIDTIKKDYDNNEKFVMSILEFLIQVEWIREDQNCGYILTPEGEKNCLESLRF